ncbi:LacI family DNA-binding transcriptional regulator [Sinosporangium siamense]|uniref:LacI family transcriptional regulator n=1 Tax=Sinosporangium siamense TaxID=1367973 RepID=A0A919RKJ7_9ACTN|nr:LacI family DNA-binding transcriptional regulator [Sinosporangium siamense]GII95541.1 LacI family transcriptional regulator [Sinosporangium siamense]
MNRTGPAKLKDVAEAAGVSISTVSRVFSNPELLSPTTVQHVREVAERLRFTPNVLARALITGVPANIGLIVPDITNPYMTTVLKAAQGRSRLSGVGVLVADTDESVVFERQAAAQLAPQSRGLILCAPRMSSTHIREIASIVPVVLINRVVSGVPSVVTDSGPAIGEIIAHLAELGHRRVAYLPGPSRSWANRQRLKAVAKRTGGLGIDLTVLNETAARYEDGIEAASAVVEASVTAVIAFDDILASGIIQGLRRTGRSVPDDVSVIGHDDVIAALVQPGLTTIAAYSDRVGRLAVERLLDPDGEQHREASIAVRADLVPRESVGRP